MGRISWSIGMRLGKPASFPILQEIQAFLSSYSVSSCPPRSILWHTLNEKWIAGLRDDLLVLCSTMAYDSRENKKSRAEKIFPWSHGVAELDPRCPGSHCGLCHPLLRRWEGQASTNTHSFQTKTWHPAPVSICLFYWSDFCWLWKLDVCNNANFFRCVWITETQSNKTG